MFGHGARHVDLILHAEHIFDRDRNEPGRRCREKCGRLLEADLPLAGRRRKRAAKRHP